MVFNGFQRFPTDFLLWIVNTFCQTWGQTKKGACQFGCPDVGTGEHVGKVLEYAGVFQGLRYSMTCFQVAHVRFVVHDFLGCFNRHQHGWFLAFCMITIWFASGTCMVKNTTFLSFILLFKGWICCIAFGLFKTNCMNQSTVCICGEKKVSRLHFSLVFHDLTWTLVQYSDMPSFLLNWHQIHIWTFSIWWKRSGSSDTYRSLVSCVWAALGRSCA